MSQVIVHNSVTVDGVMQAPGGAEEDTRGGFSQGGWAHPYQDEVMLEHAQSGMNARADLLFGRRTYEQFFSYWPHQGDNPFTDVLDRSRKYVASTTLAEPLPWENSVLLSGDAADGVAELRESGGPDLVVLGSGALIQSLLTRDLIDTFVLLIHPLVLGGGRRLFADGTAPARFVLADSVVTTTGVVIATYQRDRQA